MANMVELERIVDFYCTAMEIFKTCRDKYKLSVHEIRYEDLLDDFKGERIIMNIFPAIDTGVCSSSVRNFNAQAANLSNTKILCISRDLPFAQNRFCGAEGIENVFTLSDFISGKFGKDYELTILDGPFIHLLSRCVIVLDEEHKVLYTEQVPDIGSEPNYMAALEVLK